MRIEPYIESRQGGLGRTGPNVDALAVGVSWSTWHAVRSLGVMTATAFAAGGWWELMMLYSYGRDFGTAWLFAMPDSTGGTIFTDGPLHLTPNLPGRSSASCWRPAGARRVDGARPVDHRATNVCAAEALLAEQRRIARRRCGFIGVWMVASCVIFAASMSQRRQRVDRCISLWRLFFSAACVCTAAVALDEVTRRKVSLLEFVCLTFATLGCGYAFLHTANLVPNASMRGVFIALAAALLLARAAQEFCRRSEVARMAVDQPACWRRSSWAMSVMGISALEAADPDYQSLDGLRPQPAARPGRCRGLPVDQRRAAPRAVTVRAEVGLAQGPDRSR